MKLLLSLLVAAFVGTAYSQETKNAPTMGADGKVYYPRSAFLDGEVEKLPPPSGLRHVMIWTRSSSDPLLTTSREGDKVQISDLIDTLPANQEAATSKMVNELPDSSGANASAERIKKMEVVKGLKAIRDVRLVLSYSRFKQDPGTPANVEGAIVVECYDDSLDVCGEISPKVILGPTLGELNLSASRLAEEMSRVEAALNKNIKDIQNNDEKMAKMKKDYDSKRTRVKSGLNKFQSAPTGSAPSAPKKQ